MLADMRWHAAAVNQQMEYRGQMAIQAAVLPARAVYLIKEGSSEGFRRAVQEASTRWGGVSEPIVEVLPDGSVPPGHQQVVELSGAVGAVNVDLSEEQARNAASQLNLDCVPLLRVDRDGITRFTCHPSHTARSAVDSSHVLAREGGKLWEVAAAGDLTDETLSDMQRSALSVRRPRTNDEIGRAQVGIGSTLLQQTEAQAGEYQTRGIPGQAPAVIWVTESDNLNDCLAFWNLRALRSLTFSQAPMMLLPIDEVKYWVDFERQFSRVLARPAEFSPDAIVVSYGVERERLEHFAHLLNLQPTTDNVRVSQRWPTPPLRQPPYTCRFNIDVRQFFDFEREHGQVATFDIHVFRSGSTVRFSSPVEFGGSGATLVRFFGRPFDGLPRRSAVATLVHEHATWHGDSIQLKTTASNSYQFDLLVPSLDQARQEILNSVTARYQLSDKGRMGAALQETADISVLLDPGIFEALVDLMTPRSKTLTKELKNLAQQGIIERNLADLAIRWGSRTERRYLPAQQLAKVTRDERAVIAEKLCALGWAERGLKVACPRCGMDNFIRMPEVESVASCPGCSASASYTADRSALSIFYRLDTLVDRATDQGVFPHLMVIAAMTKAEPLSSFLPGADLYFPGEEKSVEVDVFGICGGKVVSGEVKTSSSEFTEEQMRRDVELSSSLRADVHILAAVDKVPIETRVLAQTLCDSAGLELRVLDGEQLRPA
ncbi:hypothetical protein GCM10017557_57900 [Streptomyces aurantiacus]|uniref:Uncharacterized protein n=1 Tax=Streptomyces aurantiacus TaxID=47760 RepID=A0A7G1P8L7_9ACTN|nr:hypothetical protein GCM10017557_57900 [Streptomyces aurantiacus]